VCRKLATSTMTTTPNSNSTSAGEPTRESPPSTSISGRDLDPSLAKLAGIKHEDAAIGVRKVKTCEKCGTVNSPEAPRCVQCLRPFVTTEEDERRRTAQIVFNILRQFGVEVNEKELTML